MELKLADKLTNYIENYASLAIFGHIFPCPYWANNLKDGRVFLRGYLNGKGDAQSIGKELQRLLLKSADKKHLLSDPAAFGKFARRNRIGIDCSGFAYRVMEFLAAENYPDSKTENLHNLLPGGIGKTNADSLTSFSVCRKIASCGRAKPGDLIRLKAGRHVAVITEVTDNEIIYYHSSRISEIEGVHSGRISVTDKQSGLDAQIWHEKAGDGSNFGKKYYRSVRGDGICRLKIFA